MQVHLQFLALLVGDADLFGRMFGLPIDMLCL